MDSNADGVGDFKGLMRRLDYLHALGVTAIWLMPFQVSPNRDEGYDVSALRHDRRFCPSTPMVRSSEHTGAHRPRCQPHV
jgi:hypothetical protein